MKLPSGRRTFWFFSLHLNQTLFKAESLYRAASRQQLWQLSCRQSMNHCIITHLWHNFLNKLHAFNLNCSLLPPGKRWSLIKDGFTFNLSTLLRFLTWYGSWQSRVLAPMSGCERQRRFVEARVMTALHVCNINSFCMFGVKVFIAPETMTQSHSDARGLMGDGKITK